MSFNQKSIGQNTETALMPQWTILINALKSRATLVLDLTKDFLKQGKDNKNLVYNTNLIAKEIVTNSASIQKLDIENIKYFYTKNDTLVKQTMKILVSPKIEKDDATIKKIDDFVKKMDSSDRAINAAQRKYNLACKTAKREDLLYVNPYPDEEIKVEF